MATKAAKRRATIIERYGSVDKYYAMVTAKRNQALIAKHGSLEAYQQHVAEKRKATLIAALGYDGYLERQRQTASIGGKISKRPPAKKTKRKAPGGA